MRYIFFFIEDGKTKSFDKQNIIEKWMTTIPLNPESMAVMKEFLKQKSSGQEKSIPDAFFIGWQKYPSGEVVALFNIFAEKNPLHHSTVSVKTLYEQNLNIPPIPSPPGPLRKFDFEK